jgi:plasmid stabilization system protein ParE
VAEVARNGNSPAPAEAETKSLKVLWSPRAILDAGLDAGHIRGYIARDNPLAANWVIDAIIGTADLLHDHPLLGRARPRFRELGVADYPYVIRYRVTGDTAEILSVWHDRQKRPS